MAVVLTAALVSAGCGNGSSPLTVSAASSLQLAFERYGDELERAPRFSFAGSDELAAQIRQGARPDVYAAADMRLPMRLHREGLVGAPRVFARNELVIATPSAAPAVHSVRGLARPGVDVVVGEPSVPVGAYTAKALARLPAGSRASILGNVRSREPDVAGIVGKLRAGAADAGLLYRSDIVAAAGAVRQVRLPPRLRPSIRYGIAVVKGAAEAGRARGFMRGLLGPQGRRALRDAGFEVPRR